MLVNMKRLCIVAPKSARRTVLKRLASLGCVEIDKRAGDAKLETVPESTNADRYSADILAAAKLVNEAAPYKKPLLSPRRTVSERQLYDEDRIDRAIQSAGEVNALNGRIEDAKAQISRLETYAASLRPWAGLDVPLDCEGTGQSGFICGTLPAAASWEDAEEAIAAGEAACELTRVAHDREQHYVTALCYRPDEAAALETLKSFGFSRVSFRDVHGTAADEIAECEQKISDLREDIERYKKQIETYAPMRETFEDAYDALTQEAGRDRLLSEIGYTKRTAVMFGWTPEECTEEVGKLLDECGCAYTFSDPQEGDDVPTTMKNGALGTPFNAVTEMYGMPRYGSVIDPNTVMVPFYLVFFGFMIGDAAYGILMALGCFIALKKMKPTGNMKNMLTLFMYCGVAAFVAGVLTGSWFGDAVKVFSATFLGREFSIPPAWFDPLSDPMTMLIFTLVLGLIQVLTGMTLAGVRKAKQGDVLGCVLDVLPWYLIVIGLAGGALLNKALFAAAGAGALILLTTGGRDKKGVGRVTGGLKKLYDIVGYISDVLSYSRIMALGLSGAVVAQVFNKIGTMAGGGIVGILLFIIAFVIGHVFNIAIGLLGAYVHSNRLQYIEFFGKFYEEGGRPFDPLFNKTKYTQIIKEEQAS
ncbi:MAG: V-type ATP synthase subunit I [Clostridia bacterium]|nr:V-type ATP synthase subunit I [Clostridia bacterium]